MFCAVVVADWTVLICVACALCCVVSVSTFVCTVARFVVAVLAIDRALLAAVWAAVAAAAASVAALSVTATQAEPLHRLGVLAPPVVSIHKFWASLLSAVGAVAPNITSPLLPAKVAALVAAVWAELAVDWAAAVDDWTVSTRVAKAESASARAVASVWIAAALFAALALTVSIRCDRLLSADWRSVFSVDIAVALDCASLVMAAARAITSWLIAMEFPSILSIFVCISWCSWVSVIAPDKISSTADASAEVVAFAYCDHGPIFPMRSINRPRK